MLRFWFIETFFAPPDRWLAEPWFEGTECYRDWGEAVRHLENKVWYYRDLEELGREAALVRWSKIFGGHPPPMPGSLTVCRLVEAKGQERKVGSFDWRGFRRAPGAPAGRPRWSGAEKTFYVVADPEPGRRRYLSRTTWPYLPNGVIAYRTQREALERARRHGSRGLVVLRVDAKLTPVRQLAAAELEDDPDE